MRFHSIHEFLSFSLHNAYRQKLNSILWSRVSTEYEAFQCLPVDDPDMVFSVEPFVPDLSGCYILDGKTYVRQNYLYTVTNYKLARFELDISGWEDGVLKTRVSCNRSGFMVLSGLIVDPLILYSLVERRVFPVHAACVADEREAYLFAGSSGTGKTSICLDLLQDGYSLLGDNYTLLSNGRAYSFLSPLNIFTYNLSPVIRERMSSETLALLRLKHLLWRATGGYIKIFTKLNPTQLWPEQTARAQAAPKAVFLLISSKRFQVSSISPETLARALISNMRLEIPEVLEWLAQYSFVNPQLAGHWIAQYETGLIENLAQIPQLLKVEIPGTYDPTVANRVRSLINESKGGA